MAIGKSIEQHLKKRNISLIELSKKADISYNTLYSIIKRDNTTIKPEILKKIALALEIPLSDLFDIGEEVTYYDPNDGTRDTYKKNESGKMTRHIHTGSVYAGTPALNKAEQSLLNCFRQLNSIGKLEASKRVSELAQIPKYISTKEPPTPE